MEVASTFAALTQVEWGTTEISRIHTSKVLVAGEKGLLRCLERRKRISRAHVWEKFNIVARFIGVKRNNRPAGI